MNHAQEPLKALLKLFAAAKIDYAVIGGLAVMVYGEPRMTMDIDVAMSFDSGKVGSFLTAAKRFGFSPIPGKIESFVKQNGFLPLKFKKGNVVGKCDLILAQSDLDRAAIKRARFKKAGVLKVKFISPEDLVLHKITSDRPRDLEDLRGILWRQRGKLDVEYILFWLKQISKVNHRPDILELFKSLLHSAKG